MPRHAWRTWLWGALSAAAVLGLNACDRAADGNPNAPGGPDTGAGSPQRGTGLTGSFPAGSTGTRAPMGAAPASAAGSR